MAKIKTAGLVILGIIITSILPLVIYGIAAKSVAFNENFYFNELEKKNVYSSLYVSYGLGAANYLSESEFKNIINTFLGRVLSYMRGEKEELDLSVSLGDIFSEEKIRSMLNSLPECKAGEQPFVSGITPKCLPPGSSISQIMDMIDTNQKIDIEKMLHLEVMKEKMAEFRSMIENIFMIINVLILVLIALIAGFVLMTRKSKKSMFKWLGSALLISGIVSIITALIIPFLVSSALSGMGQNILTEIISDILKEISNIVTIYSVIIAAIGAVMLVVSKKMKSPKK